ncbi:helix-turn-helix transcriptional regulator [Spirillospora sp. NPDC046719]
MTGHNAPDDTVQLHRALTRLRDSTRLPLTFGGPVGTDQRLRLSEFCGDHRGAMRGVALRVGLGLGGKVVARRRPMALNDYVSAEGISHDYDRFIKVEDLRAMVAVPVTVRRTVRGVLYGAIRSAVPLGDRIVQSVHDAARDLEQDLAVHDEIARRLDGLTEQLNASQARKPVAPAEGPSGRQWELIREGYAELRLLRHALTDERLRDRLDSVCDKLGRACATTPPAGPAPVLSARETDVLACVALGWTNPEVAADLGIAVETVKGYLRGAMRKLHSHSRLEAVVTARRLGLLP